MSSRQIRTSTGYHSILGQPSVFATPSAVYHSIYRVSFHRRSSQEKRTHLKSTLCTNAMCSTLTSSPKRISHRRARTTDPELHSGTPRSRATEELPRSRATKRNLAIQSYKGESHDPKLHCGNPYKGEPHDPELQEGTPRSRATSVCAKHSESHDPELQEEPHDPELLEDSLRSRATKGDPTIQSYKGG